MAKSRLDSWKSIAEYLKRSPRTVQRWHADLGLPVHHFGGGKGPVFSYADELDAWLSGLAKEPGEEREGSSEILAERREASAELAAQADELWEVRSNENLTAIATLYRAAIDRNPANAHAYVGLANAMIFMALAGLMRGSAAYPRAADALDRATRSRPDDPWNRCAAAWLQMAWQRSWKQAREGFDAVLGVESKLAHALSGRGLLHIAEGKLAHASSLLREACVQSPLNSFCSALLAWSCYLSQGYEQALDLIEESRAGGDSSAVHAVIESLALLQTNAAEDVLPKIEAHAKAWPRSISICGVLGYGCLMAKRTNKAQEILDGLRRMKGDSAYFVALILIGLEEKREAIACLERSAAEGSLWSLGFRFDPILSALRADHRFESLLRKMDAGIH